MKLLTPGARKIFYFFAQNPVPFVQNVAVLAQKEPLFSRSHGLGQTSHAVGTSFSRRVLPKNRVRRVSAKSFLRVGAREKHRICLRNNLNVSPFRFQDSFRTPLSIVYVKQIAGIVHMRVGSVVYLESSVVCFPEKDLVLSFFCCIFAGDKTILVMTTVALNNLWMYLQGLSLSQKDRKWLAGKLIEPTDDGTKTTRQKAYVKELLTRALEEVEQAKSGEIKMMTEDVFLDGLKRDGQSTTKAESTTSPMTI